MICLREFGGEVRRGLRPRNEVIVDVAADIAGHPPVVHHVVDVLDAAFALGIAALVVDSQVVAEGQIVALAQAPETLGHDALAHDGVLDGRIGTRLK